MSSVKSCNPEREGDALQYPSARVAAVTRVQNEITELIPNFADNVDVIVPLLDKYLMKVKIFEEICEEELSKGLNERDLSEFRKWMEPKCRDMKNFVKKMNDMINEYRETSAARMGCSKDAYAESVSNRSSCSKSSSAARVRLLEMKAKLKAQKRFFGEIEKQERQQIEIKQRELEVQQELRKIKLRQEEDEHNNLEEALNEMEGIAKEEDISDADGSKQQSYHGSSDRPIDVPNELSRAILEAQHRSYLPKHTPEVFCGDDVTLFKPFKLAFSRMIEQHCSDESSKYYYLLQYTSGRANDLVRSCQSDDAAIAYDRAWDTLNRKYANSYIVAQAYLSKLQSWPEVKYDDKQALEDLSIFITSCNNLRTDLKELSQLDNHNEIKSIVDKLPLDLRKSWRTCAGKLFDDGVNVNFSHLEKFVSQQSRLWNQPIFGELYFENKPKRKNMIEKRVFGINEKGCGAGSTDLFCPCCKRQNSHSLDDCFFFKKRSFDEKREFVIKNKICFGCLSSTDHIAKFCQQRLTCRTCKQKHPTSMHRQSLQTGSTRDVSVYSDEEGDNDHQVTVHSAQLGDVPNTSLNHGGSKVLTPMIPVVVGVLGSNSSVKTYAALDSWAEGCFMSHELVTELGGKGEKENILLTTMGRVSQCVSVTKIKGVTLSSIDLKTRVVVPIVYAVKRWPFQEHDALSASDVKGYDHLKNIPFDFLLSGVGILVGANMPSVIKPLEVVSGDDFEPYASRHVLGWAITGPVKSMSKFASSCFQTRVQLDEIEHKFDMMYRRDFVDLEADERGTSHSDKLWLERVTKSLRKVDGHYEVALPFKDETVHFSYNFKQALGCLISLKKRFETQESFYLDYKNFMEKLIDCGFLEEIPEKELKTNPGQCWFLIHHGVYHKQKGKIRVVFDCSKKNNGVSLNDQLLKGPDLINNLIGVLLRFREHRVAFMGDIESMFMQIRVPQRQVDFQRILWFPEGDLSLSPRQYRLKSHTFGAVSSPSVANFVLKQAAVDCKDSVSDTAFETITRNAYVDDVMNSVKSKSEAISVLGEVRQIAASAGFNLRGVISNSRDVLDSVPLDVRSKNFEAVNVRSDCLPSDRVLGIVWFVNDDKLGVNIKLKPHHLTRRGLLSALCSIYDPLGLLNPVLVKGRSIFQETCKLKLGWDDPLSEALSVRWNDWYNKLDVLKQFRLDRCMIDTLRSPEIELHLFSDGSLQAYGAMAYIRACTESEIKCSFVMSKVRQTPVGGSSLRTVPRIELNAAKIAVQLKLLICRELRYDIGAVYYWTDSMTVLKYISNDSSRFHRFVENRVSFIRSHSSTDEWMFVPGVKNVADILSRGVSPDVFLNCAELKCGPEFLLELSEKWPPQPALDSIEIDDRETVKNTKLFPIQTSEFDPVMRKLLDCSSWCGLLYRISVYLTLMKYLKTKVWGASIFSFENVGTAEVAIWRYVQSVYYREQISLVRAGGSLPKSDYLSRLSPFVGADHLLRVGGRIDRSNESYATKHPLILPGTCSVVKCLIRQFHVKLGHGGQQYLVSSLRERYWIVNVNVVVKQLIRTCVHCRKSNGRMSAPFMSSLPEDRVIAGRGAFYATGIDFFGPFIVSRGRGKSTEKRYGVMFSCLSSRAVHLEVAVSLDIDAFMNSFRRFKARRGHVRKVYSDRGTNLVGGCREMKRAIDQWNSECMDKTMVQQNVEWSFTTASASHFGGIWEREIRTARKILFALISEQVRLMTDDLLHTLFCEVEIIMNNRPLTPLSDDPNDLRPLTPSQLLLVAPESEVPPGLFDSVDDNRQKRWRRIQHLANTFWSRWRKEYLRILQVRQKWRKEKTPYKLGDLVLVSDLLLPRNQWCVGRIVELLPSDDGRVRSVKLRIARRDPHAVTEIERPVVKLVYLMSE